MIHGGREDYNFNGAASHYKVASTKFYWWASQNRRCPRAQATIGFWSLPKQRRGGTPLPPFQIFKFKIFTKSKTWQFLELEARPGIIFWRYLRCFLHVPKFLHKKMQLQQLAKNRHFLLVFSCFWVPPLAPNELLPRAIFDGICDVLCTSSSLQKRAVFCLRGRVGGTWRLPL